MGGVKNQIGRKFILILSCIMNIGLLGVYKYTDFIVNTINDVVGKELIKAPGIALPIGISFYTFQALSYVIDVYRKDVKAQKNFFYLALYIAFFPQLIAGPIVRYNTIADQIVHRKESWQKFTKGTCRFALGFCKKILIANNIAVIADQIFELVKGGAGVMDVPVLLAWLGPISYALQLFFDFSSYSDMAIGLGLMFGFEFEENFNYPFISKSFREFFNRWHISLGKWFSSYVYFPLGGSRVENQDLMVRNLMIVWILTGVWHGAAWNYVAWGLYAGLMIVLEKLILIEKWDFPFATLVRYIYMFVLVAIMMVIFRSESLWQFQNMLMDMFGLNHNGFFSSYFVMILKEYGLVYLAAILFSIPTKEYIMKLISKRQHKDLEFKNLEVEDLYTYKKRRKPVGNEIVLPEKEETEDKDAISVPKGVKVAGNISYVVCLSACLFFSVVVLAKGGYNPFIYFNF